MGKINSNVGNQDKEEVINARLVPVAKVKDHKIKISFMVYCIKFYSV